MTDPIERIQEILERDYPYRQSGHARHVGEDIVGQLELRRDLVDDKCGMSVRGSTTSWRNSKALNNRLSHRSASAVTRPLATASRRAA